MEECGSSQDSSRCSTPMPPPGATTTIIGSPEGNGTLGPVQIVTHEVTPTEIVCSPTVIVQHALAPGSPAANCAANSELDSGSPVSIPPMNMWDLVNPLVSTANMLMDLPISGSPIPPNPDSPGVVSIESMSPGQATSDQNELVNAMTSLTLDEDGGSPAPKCARTSA